MVNYGRGKNGFEAAFEAAIKETSDEPNWDAIIVCCDMVRDGDVKPKFALDTIQKGISSDEVMKTRHSLQVLESATKNCGAKLHVEIGKDAFMNFIKSQINSKDDSQSKCKLLELVQLWVNAFGSKAEFAAVKDVYNVLKCEGHNFPEINQSEAMFTLDGPPEWAEDSSCSKCSTVFGTLTRRHHCRNCGQSFCGKCSSKSCAIPKYGWVKPVRVCDACYGKLTSPSEPPSSKSSSRKTGDESGLPEEYLNSSLYKQSLTEQTTKPAGGRTQQQIEEDEQLQLALAISQSEAEAKAQEKKRRSNFMSLDAQPPGGGFTPSASVHSSYTTPPASQPVSQPSQPPAVEEENISPELQRYLNRNYWQGKKSEPKVTQPSAPPATSEPIYSTVNKVSVEPQADTSLEAEVQGSPALDEENVEERTSFMLALSSSIDIMVNRMRSNSMRGRNIINDSAVQTLFNTLQNMQPQLLQYMQAQEEKRSYQEGLQDKLAQLRDAREALDQLRAEHEDKRKREAEERERKKQIQMAIRLEALRKKKQELLETQRQAAYQKMAQQQADIRMRLEMQKQQAQMRQMQLHGFPQELQPGSLYMQSQDGQYNTQTYSQQQQQQQYEQPGVYQQQPAYVQQTDSTGAPMNQYSYQQSQPAPNIPSYTQAGLPQQGVQPVPQSAPGMQQVPSGMQQLPGGPAPMSQPMGYGGMSQIDGSQQMVGQNVVQPASGDMMYQQQSMNPYNMQGMTDALPQSYQQNTGQQSVGYQQPGYTDQQYMGNVQQPVNNMQQPVNNMQQSVNNMQQPVNQYQQQQPDQPNQAMEVQLISF